MTTAFVLAIGLVPSALGAQDVEMLAEHYGTTPPGAYFEEIGRNPGAYRPARGWRSRLGLGVGTGAPGIAALRGLPGLGPRGGSVTGTFEIPLLLGLYSDTPSIPSADVGNGSVESLTQGVVQREFFDGPNSRFATITELYTELSGLRVVRQGEAERRLR